MLSQLNAKNRVGIRALWQCADTSVLCSSVQNCLTDIQLQVSVYTALNAVSVPLGTFTSVMVADNHQVRRVCIYIMRFLPWILQTTTGIYVELKVAGPHDNEGAKDV